jgi:hypothetical protein
VRVTVIGLAVILVPAALLDGLYFLIWWNEGINGTAWARGPYELAALPVALWLTPVLATVVILVVFFSGKVEGSER